LLTQLQRTVGNAVTMGRVAGANAGRYAQSNFAAA